MSMQRSMGDGRMRITFVLIANKDREKILDDVKRIVCSEYYLHILFDNDEDIFLELKEIYSYMIEVED